MSDHNHEHLTASLRLVAAITLEAIKPLPLSKQLMACDGLAAALKTCCPGEAAAAAAAADALRKAEACQLVFTELLRHSAA